MKMVKESLNEFAKHQQDEDEDVDSVGSTDDSWYKSDEDDEDVDVNDIDVDTSDMESDEMEIEDDSFDDQLYLALNNEIKIPEFNRRTLKFRLKGQPDKAIFGVPMAKMKDDAFLFKIDGTMKRYNIRDIIVESEKRKNRAKQVNEELDFDGWRDKL